MVVRSSSGTAAATATGLFLGSESAGLVIASLRGESHAIEPTSSCDVAFLTGVVYEAAVNENRLYDVAEVDLVPVILTGSNGAIGPVVDEALEVRALLLSLDQGTDRTLSPLP